jgi:hypothetical protein
MHAAPRDPQLCQILVTQETTRCTPPMRLASGGRAD